MELSKEEKGLIFDIVNSMYLNYKGDEKKNTKKAFKSLWKPDNNLYKFMMCLYNAEDVINLVNDRFNNSLKEGYGIPLDWETKKVSFKKYHGMCVHLQEEIIELEKQLENIEQNKDIIKQSEHDEIVNDLNKKHKEIIDSQQDEIIKLKNLLRDKEDSYNHNLQLQKEKTEYFEKAFNTYCS